MKHLVFAALLIAAEEEPCLKEPVQILFVSGPSTEEKRALIEKLQKELGESFLKTAEEQVVAMMPQSEKRAERVPLLFEEIVLLLAEHGEYLIIDEERGSLEKWKQLLKDYEVLYVNTGGQEKSGFDLNADTVAAIKKAIDASGCSP